MGYSLKIFLQVLNIKMNRNIAKLKQVSAGSSNDIKKRRLRNETENLLSSCSSDTNTKGHDFAKLCKEVVKQLTDVLKLGEINFVINF